LRAESKDSRDLAIAAKGNWCLAYDNISYVNPELSDALCRLSTGGGLHATRQLYTDDVEKVFDYKRPVILNGIEELVTRPDLLERAIVLDLPAIKEETRRTEKEFWAAFELARPRIMGALYNAIAEAIKNLPNTTLSNPPRMADFAMWAHASEPAWGSVAGRFLPAYYENQQAIKRLPLESSLIYDPLVKLLAKHGTWEGIATALLKELAIHGGCTVRHPREWPVNAKKLSDQLRRLVPNLRTVGIFVEFKQSGNRMIYISTDEKFESILHDLQSNDKLPVPRRMITRKWTSTEDDRSDNMVRRRIAGIPR